jgi:predicted nucleic acid-binding Zn ribbon protein
MNLGTNAEIDQEFSSNALGIVLECRVGGRPSLGRGGFLFGGRGFTESRMSKPANNSITLPS